MSRYGEEIDSLSFDKSGLLRDWKGEVFCYQDKDCGKFHQQFCGDDHPDVKKRKLVICGYGNLDNPRFQERWYCFTLFDSLGRVQVILDIDEYECREGVYPDFGTQYGVEFGFRDYSEELHIIKPLDLPELIHSLSKTANDEEIKEVATLAMTIGLLNATGES